MRRGSSLVLLALLAVAFWFYGARDSATTPALPGQQPVAAERALPQADAAPARPSLTQRAAGSPREALPPEAFQSIELIQQGGPFPHRQDGGVFGNREGRLPRQPRGWYREYTVDTPTVGHRGARRIVTGGAPPTEWYYTDDHYDSFRRFDPTEETR